MANEVDSLAIDPGKFAEKLLGRPLWPHQLEVARSGARYRVICAGRQVGKSAVLASIALFEAMTRRNILVMLISAGERSSQRLLEECASRAGHSDMLRGSVLDESKSLLTLSNGSRILSVPASERQIRGWSVDLLIVDEAAFVAEEVWSAAEPAIIARPGSRVILTSTPFGVDHFFRRLWRRGMDAPDASYESWHWPSSTSPLIDDATLAEIRSHENPITFAREYLAEWADESGLLLTAEELQNAVLDYEMVDPERAWVHHGQAAVGGNGLVLPPQLVAGVDYGSQNDANALVLVGALDDHGVNVDLEGLRRDGTTADHVFFVPWLEYHHKMSYQAFADRVAEVGRGYYLRQIASETNGVGAGAHEFLELAIVRSMERQEAASVSWGGWRSKGTYVAPVWTDNKRKQAMFGRLKGMLQAGTLVLPRHTELLKQLAALEMTELASGSVQISVPERFGHDDLAMALGQALMGITNAGVHWTQRFRPITSRVEFVELPSGVRVPKEPRLLNPANSVVFNFQSRGAEREQPL